MDTEKSCSSGASYLFYGAWDRRFCSLTLLSTVIDYAAGGYLGRNPDSPRRKTVLIISLCANLAILGFFKYFNQIAFQPALTLFLIGFIKKSCISDNIARLIDPVFANPDQYTAISIWIATLFYAVQIYCDFSGYTGMAIAVAALLGYKLVLNFNFPYFASNIALFWQRWHISLSTWLRDYLYIPLGGNRSGKLKTYRNLLITMLLGGLWHGAAWNFVIWGALHGIALHRFTTERLKIPAAIGKSLGMVATFYWVCLAWIFFRCTTLPVALEMAKAYVTFQSPGSEALNTQIILWFIPLIIAHALARKIDLPEKSRMIPDWAYAAGLGVAIVLSLLLVPEHTKPFIYFQF